MNYTDQLAAVAAYKLQKAAEDRRIHGLLTKKSRGALRRMAGQPPAPPHTTFPNSLGNYSAKRKERPLVAPLAPRERFFRLVAAYLAFAGGRRRVIA